MSLLDNKGYHTHSDQHVYVMLLLKEHAAARGLGAALYTLIVHWNANLSKKFDMAYFVLGAVCLTVCMSHQNCSTTNQIKTIIFSSAGGGKVAWYLMFAHALSFMSQTHFHKKGRVWWIAYTRVPPHCTVSNHTAEFRHMMHYITVWATAGAVKTL